jgi:predicted DNA-binding transcriptional regulator AlpA
MWGQLLGRLSAPFAEEVKVWGRTWGALQTISDQFPESGMQKGLVDAVGGARMAGSESKSELMDVPEIARILHVPVSWVYERTRRRGKERMPHIKLGKYLRFELAEVRTWLDGLRSY